jgi:phosphate/sulfate permease
MSTPSYTFYVLQLLTALAWFAHGYNTGSNVLGLTNHYLIGFEANSMVGNTYMAL